MGRRKKNNNSKGKSKGKGSKGKGGQGMQDEEETTQLTKAQRKQQERLYKRQLKKERQRRMFQRDDIWEDNFRKLDKQVGRLGLKIRDVAADGNCLFSAVSDQVYGNPASHADVRRDTMDFIEQHRADFEPFVEDDEPFQEYVNRLRRLKVWGGHLEIQALSLCFEVNITIHLLEQPRWEIVNFAPSTGARTIHLSYHDGQHYASVRTQGDEDGPADQISIASGVGAPSGASGSGGGGGDGLSDNERRIMQITGFDDLVLIRSALEDHHGNVEDAIDELTMMAFTLSQMEAADEAINTTATGASGATEAEATADPPATTSATDTTATTAATDSVLTTAAVASEAPTTTAPSDAPADAAAEADDASDTSSKKGKKGKGKPRSRNPYKGAGGKGKGGKTSRQKGKKLSNRERKRLARLEKARAATEAHRAGVSNKKGSEEVALSDGSGDGDDGVVADFGSLAI